MSCFPKHKPSYSDAALYGAINKVCFQADFATRKSSKIPSMKQVPRRDPNAGTGLPRFMQPSRAAKKRNEENLKKREATAIKKADEAKESYKKEQNALAKQKKVQANVTFQARLSANLDTYDTGVADDKAAAAAAAAGADAARQPPMSPIKITSATSYGDQQQERFSPIKNRRQMAAKDGSSTGVGARGATMGMATLAKAMNEQLAAETEKDSDNESSKRVPSIPELKIVSGNDAPTQARANAQQSQKLAPASSGVRYGGGESFSFMSHTVDIPKLAAKRCYRVLTYANTPEGRAVMDIAEGNLYWCRTGPQKRRITPNAVAFDSRDMALSERFPSTQVGVASSGNGTLPRVLVSFDCWGKASRRKGGGGAAKYEFCKFLKIVEFLNSPTSGSKKTSEHPTVPNYYPKKDRHFLNPRKDIDRSIYIDKRFDTPWIKANSSNDAPVSSRTKNLMSALNPDPHPPVTHHKVPPRASK